MASLCPLCGSDLTEKYNDDCRYCAGVEIMVEEFGIDPEVARETRTLPRNSDVSVADKLA